jgi:hypothetical protein
VEWQTANLSKSSQELIGSAENVLNSTGDQWKLAVVRSDAGDPADSNLK